MVRFNQKDNQIVHVKIDIPKKITARQEELPREFDAESEKSCRGISGRVSRGGCGRRMKIHMTKRKRRKLNNGNKLNFVGI